MEILISISKAAQMLGVTPKTLRVWDKKKFLSPIRIFGNQRRYKLSVIEQLQQGQIEDPQKQKQKQTIETFQNTDKESV